MNQDFRRALAIALAAMSSGSGGTTDYEALTNKPSIGGVTLIGDLTLADLGIVVDDQLSTTSTNPVQNAVLTALLNAFPYTNITGKPQINGVTLTGNVTLSQLGLNAIWVGTRVELTAALANNEIADGTLIFLTDEPDVDNLPMQNSTNLVYSGGVWTALQGKLSVEEVNALPTTNIKTNTIYLVPKFMNSTGNIDETNGYFYVRSSINNVPVYYKYIYSTGFYDDTIRSDTSTADFSAIYAAINNNTFPVGTCNVEVVTGESKKDVYINLDGTTNSWELIGNEIDNTLSTASTNPVENRVITNAINEINSFPKVQKKSDYNSAYSSTQTQAQIDANNGEIIDSVISTSFMLEGVHGIDGTGLEDQVVISVSGLTKDGATTYPYVSFLPDWDIIRVRPYTTAAGVQGTEITIGLKTKFYEPDEVRNLANGSSITRAGGDSYSKDANGNITISIPEKFWHFYATCHYKG